MSIKQSRGLGWLFAIVGLIAFGAMLYLGIENWVPYAFNAGLLLYAIILIRTPQKAGEPANDIFKSAKSIIKKKLK